MAEKFELPWDERATWSPAERVVARKAFERALAKSLLKVSERARQMLDKDGIPWTAHDYLSQQRRRLDELFDYRYSRLMLVFGRLIADQELTFEDLSGLREDKLARIRSYVDWFGGENSVNDKNKAS